MRRSSTTSLFVPRTEGQFILRISAVEALWEQTVLDARYLSAIEHLEQQLTSQTMDEEIGKTLQRTLDNAKRKSLRLAYMTKFRTLRSQAEAKAFEDLYGEAQQARSLVDNSGKVSIKTSAGVTVATLKVSGTYTSANFHVGKDASGHALVTYAATAANAAIDEVGGGKLCVPLGGYGSQLPSPIPETHSGAVPLDSLLSAGFQAPRATLAVSADHHDRNFGGARDAGGIGVGWDGPIGHGPGADS